MSNKTYYEKTLDSIEVNCNVRGVIEVESIRAVIAERYGVALVDMDEPQLKRVNRDLPNLLLDYLDGLKRRLEVVAQPEELDQGEVIAESN